jgi:hypothetical protein
MYSSLTSRRSGKKIALAAGLMLSSTMAMSEGIDSSLAGWLGREITIASSTFNDHIPVGGKLTFIYDSGDDVVRVCTRTVAGQRGPWRMDLAGGCNVTLMFTRGDRYCTLEDVKAGNGEVLSGCHRLRSRDVALRPSTTKGAIELQDMIVFLVPAERGKHAIAILVDSPSRVTEGGVAVGED